MDLTKFPRERFWTVLLAMLVMFVLVLDNDNSAWKEGFRIFSVFVRFTAQELMFLVSLPC